MKRYMSLYYKTDKFKAANKIRRSSAKCKEQNRQAGIRFKARNPDYYKIYYKKRYAGLRDMVIATLGGKCVKCGFKDVRALQIDHVNGGGYKAFNTKSFSRETYWRSVLVSYSSNKGEYQLLCANCNWIKRYENNEK